MPGEIAGAGSVVLPLETTFLVGPDEASAAAVWPLLFRFLLLPAGLQSVRAAGVEGEAVEHGFAATGGGTAGADVGFAPVCEACWSGAVCANAISDACRASGAANHAISRTIVAAVIYLIRCPVTKQLVNEVYRPPPLVRRRWFPCAVR